jgi:hypothetical protein
MQFEQANSYGSPFQQRRSEVIRQSLDHLLAMAQSYRSEGNPRQAMDIYWKVFDDYSDTTQGQEAQESLLSLAEEYEREGYRHQSRAVYVRLL